MILFFYTLVLGLISVLVQMFVPEIHFLGGARLALPALMVIYAAICLRDLRVFIVAAAVGFYIDLLCPNRIGVSVIALSLMASLILTQTQGRLLQRLDFQLLVVLVGSFLYFSLTYFFFLMQIWSGSVTPGDWLLITYGSILNTIVSPFLFALLNLPLRLMGWKPGSRSEYTGYAAE